MNLLIKNFNNDVWNKFKEATQKKGLKLIFLAKELIEEKLTEWMEKNK